MSEKFTERVNHVMVMMMAVMMMMMMTISRGPHKGSVFNRKEVASITLRALLRSFFVGGLDQSWMRPET